MTFYPPLPRIPMNSADQDEFGFEITKALAQEIGRKDDREKLLAHLFPIESFRAITRVLMFGAKKYGEFNWEKLENPRVRYYNAAIRHLHSWLMNEGTDPDTGESHLAHAGCCIVFLLALEARGLLPITAPKEASR